MPIFDIFRKKKKEKKTKEGKKPASAEGLRLSSAESPTAGKEEKKEPKQPRAIETETSKVKRQTELGQSYRILKRPHITEKASDLAEKNQYVFRIFPRTNKIEVKRTIEDTYGVDVVSVKIINVHEKKRRLGKIQGTRPGYKKAIVKIKEGQKIEVLPR